MTAENSIHSSPVHLVAYDLLGRRHEADGLELVRIATSFEALLFYFIAAALFALFDGLGFSDYGAGWQSFLVFLISIITQVCGYFLVLAAWGWAQGRFGLFALFLPIATVIAFSVNFPVTLGAMWLFSGHDFTSWFNWPAYVQGFLLTLGFEMLFISFVLPLVHRVPQKLSGEHTVSVAGEIFAIEELVFIRSQEHHLQIVTLDGEATLRARLGDVLGQMRDEDGVLAHRSYWVSRGGISGFESAQGNDFIVTSVGEKLAVARTRRDEVQEWIRTHAEP